jgi:hypothetical protein
MYDLVIMSGMTFVFQKTYELIEDEKLGRGGQVDEKRATGTIDICAGA